MTSVNKYFNICSLALIPSLAQMLNQIPIFFMSLFRIGDDKALVNISAS